MGECPTKHEMKLLVLDIRDGFASQARRIWDLLMAVFGESVHNEGIIDEATCSVGKCARAEATEKVARELAEALREQPNSCLDNPSPCGYGGYPHCRQAAGISCSPMIRNNRMADALAAYDALGLKPERGERE